MKVMIVIMLLIGAACATPTTPIIEPVTFTFSPEAPLVHQEVQFRTPATGAWHWEFGDGATSVEQNPVHRFGGPKCYEVHLTTMQGKACKTIVVRAI